MVQLAKAMCESGSLEIRSSKINDFIYESRNQRSGDVIFTVSCFRLVLTMSFHAAIHIDLNVAVFFNDSLSKKASLNRL